MTEEAKLFSLSLLNPISAVSWFLILSGFCHFCIFDSSQECYFTCTFHLFPASYLEASPPLLIPSITKETLSILVGNQLDAH